MLRLLFITLLTLFIYVPYIKVGGIVLFVGYFSFFLPWLYLIKHNKLIIDKDAQVFLYLMHLSFAVVCFTYIINIFFPVLPTPDLRGIKLHISIIFIFLSTYAIYKLLLKNYSSTDFLKIIYYALSVNVFIILLLYISQPFADFFYSIIEVNPKTFTYAILRYPGFLYDGASYLSVFNAFIFILGLMIFFIDKQSSIVEKIFLLIMQMLIVVSMIFIGRAGFVVLGLGLLLFFTFSIHNRYFLKKQKIQKTVYLVLAIVILTPIAIFVINYLNMNWYINWAFGFILNLFDGSGTDSSVRELLQNHYFIIDSILHFLFGLSDFRTTQYATYSADPGYIIYVHGVGLIGLMAYLVFMLYLVCFVIKNFKYSKKLAFLICFIVLSLLITNTKDFYIFYPYSHYILLFLLLFKLIDSKKKNLLMKYPQNQDKF